MIYFGVRFFSKVLIMGKKKKKSRKTLGVFEEPRNKYATESEEEKGIRRGPRSVCDQIMQGLDLMVRTLGLILRGLFISCLCECSAKPEH